MLPDEPGPSGSEKNQDYTGIQLQQAYPVSLFIELEVNKKCRENGSHGTVSLSRIQQVNLNE